MADLTPLDEKLGEVLGLAQAAQAATEKVTTMEGAEDFESGLEGKKTAIREKAGETKSEAKEMMSTYLGGEEEALDGFEFLSMAEAGELCHWEIVEKMSATIGEGDVHQLASWAVGVQREHVEAVRRASLALAVDEIREAVGS
jgi:hypothetical protein